MYWTSYAYDDLNRVVSETAPNGAVTTYVYSGLTASVTNAKGQTTRRVRNSQGQLAQVTNAAGTPAASSISYAYDPFGNLLRTTDAAGNVTTMGYDLRGRKMSMADPDLGNWTYGYNVLDELVTQTDAKKQTTTLVYDQLGRMTRRAAPDLIGSWVYDSCAKGIGKLCQATATNGYSRTHRYDSLGRPAGTSTTIDANYNASTSYDVAGRIATLTYPTGFALKYVYNAQGYLAQVRNNASNALYWQASAANAAGQVTSEQLGNGLTTTRSFDPASGWLSQISSGAGNAVQNQNYAYDSLGNLTSRSDANANLSENYAYDALNRLIMAVGTGAPTRSVSYNALGNITRKSDVGNYSYGARPHALASVTGSVNGVVNPGFIYDANGNLTSGAGRTLTWNSFDMPVSITKGATTDSFSYGPEHQRIRQTSPTGTTIYLSAPHYEKVTQPGGLIEHKHYLYVGSGLIGLYTQRSNSVNDTRYFHTDHLGSVSVVSNATGALVERLSYDAWGKRRQLNGSDDPGNRINPGVNRGYTGHEQLDAGGMGLVHMNGRIYDPLLGRVMSADPIVQAPGYSQSFNRYSYGWNNPLKYVDPSGYEVSYGPWYYNDYGALQRNGMDSNGDYGVMACTTGFCTNPATNSTLATTSASLQGEQTSLSGNAGLSLGGGLLNQNAYSIGGSSSASFTTSTTTSTTSSGTTTSTTATYTNISGGVNGCTTNCVVSGNTVSGNGAGATGSNSGASAASGIIGAASGGWALNPGQSSGLPSGFALAGAIAVAEPTPIGELVVGAAIVGYGAYTLVDKMAAEIQGVAQRNLGPHGEVYSLRANQAGDYPNVRGGTTFLNAGDVYKYGETTQPDARYSEADLRRLGLRYIPEFRGSQMMSKIIEKQRIYGHFFEYGALPPGNRIFR